MPSLLLLAGLTSSPGCHTDTFYKANTASSHSPVSLLSHPRHLAISPWWSAKPSFRASQWFQEVWLTFEELLNTFCIQVSRQTLTFLLHASPCRFCSCPAQGVGAACPPLASHKEGVQQPERFHPCLLFSLPVLKLIERRLDKLRRSKRSGYTRLPLGRGN